MPCREVVPVSCFSPGTECTPTTVLATHAKDSTARPSPDFGILGVVMEKRKLSPGGRPTRKCTPFGDDTTS